MNVSNIFADEYAEIGLPITQVYDMDAHLGGNQNWWIVQGDNGLIYNATGVGLNEWDGENWNIYKTPNQSLVRSISQWTDGRTYAGTMNDIGYYQANDKGVKQYYSLLKDWTFEDRQFGDIWSTAANRHGVMFMSSSALLFWDGQRVSQIKRALTGKHRIFSIGDSFYYKSNDQAELYVIDFNQDSKQGYSITPSKLHLPTNAVIRQLFKNNEHHLVAITAFDGIYEESNHQFVQRTAFESFNQPDLHVYNGMQASDGFYYVVSLNHGLFILDESFRVVRNYTEQHNLKMNTILSVTEDRQGNIWLAGVPHIVKMIPPHIYSQYKTSNNSKIMQQANIYNHKIVLAGSGVQIIQQNENKLAPPEFKQINDQPGLSWDVIEYHDHLIYAGAGGVFAISPQSFQDTQQSFQDTQDSFQTPKSILLAKASWAKGLAIDPVSGDLFAATFNGLYRIRFSESQSSETRSANNQWSQQLIPGTLDDLTFIAISDQGIIWVGTPTQELYRIENSQDDSKNTIVQKFKDADGLGANNVIPFKLSSGVVFGTNDGVMNYESDRNPQLQFDSSYPELFNTKGNDVYRMVQDKFQRVWYRVSGLTGYIKKDEQGIWHTNQALFNPFDGRSVTGFVAPSQNVLWFVKSDGQVYRLNIGKLQKPPNKGILNIREISNLDNNDLLFGGSGDSHLPLLDQQHNSIRIKYALAENTIPQAIEYRHRLLGSSNEDWSEWISENKKDYTLLSGGDYHFEVQAKDGWGNSSKNSLAFTVLPPWYLTSLAKWGYVFLGLLVIGITSWMSQRWRASILEKRNKELEAQVISRTREVQHKAKLLEQEKELKERFFSNVSHEFRTPLTLTLAPLEAILTEDSNIDDRIKAYVNTALRNAKKMLHLVGQILDINRLESNQFQLHIAQYDLSELINRLVIRFSPLALANQQTLSSHNTENPFLLYFDINQIDRCISNLLSNAVKYSGEQSDISISIITNNSQHKVGIQICDTGMGIPVNEQDKIFDRFYQGVTASKSTQPGTGIGLSLVKELINLHHGTIELSNKQENGCCFTIWLDTAQSQFETHKISDQQQSIDNIDEHRACDLTLPATTVNTDELTTLLIIDDNAELRHFISLKLAGFYKIIEAENGQEGFEKAISCLPDLIISDVMMPIMDGLELTRSVRADPITESIPIILLTAKSSKRNTIEGLESGADDYLVKPFDTSELFARVNGIINRNKLLRRTLEKELLTSRIPLKSKASFKDNLKAEVSKKLCNPEFTIEQLANALAMSRVTLNRKCNRELSMTASQYMTQMRMTFAMKLLKENKYNISEIAFASGYASLNYFTRSFKKYFGDSPTSIKPSQ